MPIFGGDPQKRFKLSTKSGGKRLLQRAGLPIPPGASEIYDVGEFFNSLTLLVLNFPRVSTWVLKSDDEFQGRGTAYF